MSTNSDLLSGVVAVLGIGVTGQAVARFLDSRQVSYDLFDEKSGFFGDKQVRSELIDPTKYSLAIVSPGWKPDHSLVSQFRGAGVKILSEIDLAWLIKDEVAPSQKWVAVTGTNGKTTTIQMIQSIFDVAEVKGLACGNVGLPAIAAVTQEPALDYLALELSSFQIEWSELARFESSAILNIAEDHIDWHGSFESYANSKMALAAKSSCAILNAQDPEIVNRSTSLTGRKVFYSLDTPMKNEIGLVENLVVDRAFVDSADAAEVLAELSDINPQVPHNVSNALAAAAIGRSIGIPLGVIKAGLNNFKLDHHRLELILERDSVRWIDDSKATNPHAAIAGILSHTSVIWIAGGLAKGASMDELVRRATPRLKAVILIGRDRELIADALSRHAPSIPIHRVGLTESADQLMRDVVSIAISVAEKGDAVLLAPACASMDQFDSYAHRGDLFAQAVLEQVKR